MRDHGDPWPEANDMAEPSGGVRGYADACMEEPSWWCDERSLARRDLERARESMARLRYAAAHPDPARVAANEEEMRRSAEQTNRWYEAWLKRGGE